MSVDFAREAAPATNLTADLEAAGLPTVWSWRPSGWVVFPTVDPDDNTTIAAIGAVLAAYIPEDPPPGPPSLEERVAALETWRTSLEPEV